MSSEASTLTCSHQVLPSKLAGEGLWPAAQKTKYSRNRKANLDFIVPRFSALRILALHQAKKQGRTRGSSPSHANNSASSRGELTVRSGGASHKVCGANPWVTPLVAMPKLRPVKTSL